MKQILILSFWSLLVMGCASAQTAADPHSPIEALRIENDSLKQVIAEIEQRAHNQMIRSLTFQDNNAEHAMNFYMEVFEHSEVLNLQRWPANSPGKEGTIMQATFSLNGNLFMVSDSPPVHEWDFSPAVAHYIECDSEEEIEHLFAQLSVNADVPMPLNNYGFSKKFAWIIDQFGVSWQLNLN